MSGQDGTSEGSGGPVHALLIQHRELLSIIERIESLLWSSDVTTAEQTTNADARTTPDPTTKDESSELGGLLRSFVRALEIHFDAERESLENDFDDAPEMRAAFLKLDEDHPRILARVKRALELLEAGEQWGDMASLIRTAVSDFREHEAREDALFTMSS